MKTKEIRKTGEIAAALIAICVGLTSMIASHIWSTLDQARANLTLLKIGSWMPGWWGIGSFAGKETVGLALWLVSWFVLHFICKHINISLTKTIYGFSISFLVILVFTWPPVYHSIWGWLPTIPF